MRIHFIRLMRRLRTRRRIIRYAPTAILAFCVPRAASAQDSATASRPGWAVGASIGMPGEADEPYYALATIGVSATQLRANRLGLDFSVGTAPLPFIVGFVNVAARGGVALPLAVGPALLVPSVGLSALGTGSIDGGGGASYVGYNVGTALLLPTTTTSALRVGLTRHWFRGSSGAVWLFELGAVRLPRR